MRLWSKYSPERKRLLKKLKITMFKECKMAKHTLKILRFHTARFLKHAWPFYNIMHEKVNGF